MADVKRAGRIAQQDLDPPDLSTEHAMGHVPSIASSERITDINVLCSSWKHVRRVLLRSPFLG